MWEFVERNTCAISYDDSFLHSQMSCINLSYRMIWKGELPQYARSSFTDQPVLSDFSRPLLVDR
ncbi:MAG: hypothetical protein ACUVSY_12325, partial [Roseiflexus sp.]